eukprot:scaffold24280_cov55-Cyclotella_meneghiniana.AAC.6
MNRTAYQILLVLSCGDTLLFSRTLRLPLPTLLKLVKSHHLTAQQYPSRLSSSHNFYFPYTFHTGTMPSLSFEALTGVCLNDNKLTESELLLQLRAILQSAPGVIQEKDSLGQTPLHYAAWNRSPELCQLLIDMNPDLVNTVDNIGRLPIHFACSTANFQTIKYLYQKYPESINIQNNMGKYPLHSILAYGIGRRDDEIEMLKFMLKNDRGAVSLRIRHRGAYTTALHLACESQSLEIIKLVFDAYPEAIHIEDDNGHLPMNLVRGSPDLLSFFQSQIQLENQAREDRTIDGNGELPIHRALRNRDVSMGGIKLMMAANPNSINVINSNGHNLLHIASRACNFDTVKYLAGCDDDVLKTLDNNENLPLHYACLGGNVDVIPFIIEQSTFGVTQQNSDKLTPMELLLYEAECDRDSMEYVEAVRCLLLANPVDTLRCHTKKDKEQLLIKEGVKRKRV